MLTRKCGHQEEVPFSFFFILLLYLFFVLHFFVISVFCFLLTSSKQND